MCRVSLCFVPQDCHAVDLIGSEIVMEHFLGYSIMAGRQMPALESKKKTGQYLMSYKESKLGWSTLTSIKPLLINKVNFRKLPDSSIKFKYIPMFIVATVLERSMAKSKLRHMFGALYSTSNPSKAQAEHECSTVSLQVCGLKIVQVILIYGFRVQPRAIHQMQ